MRYTRQNKIIELVCEHEVDTQEKLAELLKENGFDVTQATVSRDIKELQLVKALTPAGQYKYILPGQAVRQEVDRLLKIFKGTIQSVVCAGNMVVVKTLTGCANAACEAIDSLQFPHIIGSLAGDNTIFIVCSDSINAAALTMKFEELLNE
jgi:transcriptional regulator of arginine metabolism